ncbi:hypothetical protein PoB_000853200 [Plakobranchus ocellatus]|uniref:Uncharacterized protein n=1 Tax=Plakobranchus ocellatus TaxID=259542 RepID=A0AAV3YIL3_9GAST|nr:hypothetical protein PoB_000853200 [Plakobranchus ocellatus]
MLRVQLFKQVENEMNFFERRGRKWRRKRKEEDSVLYIASPQQDDLRLQALRQAMALLTGCEPATEASLQIRADSLSTVPPILYKNKKGEEEEEKKKKKK